MVSSSARRDYSIVDALNAEWSELGRGHHEEVTRWSAAHAVLGGCADLDDVLRAIRRSPDAALGALLIETANAREPSAGRGLTCPEPVEGVGTIAARTVLQAMLGKVVRLAARDPGSDVGAWVSAMWWRICTYPLTQRSEHIAANLALDTLKQVRRDQGWSARVTLVEPGPALDEVHDRARHQDTLDHQAELDNAGAEQLLTLAGRLGIVSGPSQRLLHTVYALGLSGADAAVRHSSTAGSVRTRCSRAVRQLADAAPLLAAAL